ncbi:MAG: response regulator transcription factor [Actinomycetota bacterium]
MNEPIRVFVVEDHDIVRRGINAAIQDAGDMVVVGQADEESAAVELIRERLPDVVLLDLNLRFGHGRRVVEQILQTHPDIRFLALTVSTNQEDVVSVIRAGARGYLTKEVPTAELLDTIRSVHDGAAVVSPALAAFALEAFGSDTPEAIDDEIDALTAREREVATLIAKGYTNRLIGTELDISHKTVEKHVGHILEKLALTNRTQVTRWVLENPTLEPAQHRTGREQP